MIESWEENIGSLQVDSTNQEWTSKPVIFMQGSLLYVAPFHIKTKKKKKHIALGLQMFLYQ